MKVFLGLFWMLMLFSFCFAVVFTAKCFLRPKKRKPPPEPPAPPPEPVYYIVEKKSRKKNVYSAPKKIKFE